MLKLKNLGIRLPVKFSSESLTQFVSTELRFLYLFEEVGLETLLKNAAFKFSKERSIRFEETHEMEFHEEFPVQSISHLRRAPFNCCEVKEFIKSKSEISPDAIFSLFFFPV